MYDMNREIATKVVYDRLRDPSFRSHLTGVAPDGSKPIAVAMLDDRFVDLAAQTVSNGGVTNVLIFMDDNKILGVTLSTIESSGVPDDGCEALSDCTVGLFVARMLQDRGTSKYSVRLASQVVSDGVAELVSL
jgi:hypothetical protein